MKRNKWLIQLERIIKKHLKAGVIDNEILAAEIDISKRHLFRKVKSLTGLPPNKYIRQYRLFLALEYLENGTYKTVNEVSEAIGYRNTSYFIQQFEKQFGKKPLSVLQKAGWR